MCLKKRGRVTWSFLAWRRLLDKEKYTYCQIMRVRIAAAKFTVIKSIRRAKVNKSQIWKLQHVIYKNNKISKILEFKFKRVWDLYADYDGSDGFFFKSHKWRDSLDSWIERLPVVKVSVLPAWCIGLMQTQSRSQKAVLFILRNWL